MNRADRPYWIALMAGAGVGLLAAGLIYGYRGSLATWQLDHKQGPLWEIVLKAVAGYVAVIGAVITAFKYIDEKARQREQDRRDERKDFLRERQAVYRRLGLSLARIMNYDPNDPEWNTAKERFFEIYWGEIPLVADEAVMKVVEPFSHFLHRAQTKEDKEALAHQVSAITNACRKSLGDAWRDIKNAEEETTWCGSEDPFCTEVEAPVKGKLDELIDKAKRDLRKSSGLPLSPEEAEAERLHEEVERLQLDLYKKLGAEVSLALMWRVVVEDGRPIAQFNVDDQLLAIRRDRGDFVLFSGDANNELELRRIPEDDPEFANRLLVAVGDFKSTVL